MKKHIFKTITLFSYILIITACTKKDGACDNGYSEYINEVIIDGSFNELKRINYAEDQLPSTLYYEYSGNNVRFIIGGTVDQICASEHMKVRYSFFTTDKASGQTKPMKIKGEALWDIFLGNDEIIMHQGLLIDIPNNIRESTRELGLKQVFEESAAKVYFLLTIEFETTGSGLEADYLYLKNGIQYLSIVSKYSKY
ncbi:MAG: hypothetical protein HOP11_03295 [Saprospiraceae bacterium]|nr:hypothetical protein [Saprospiraceae bacterium]